MSSITARVSPRTKWTIEVILMALLAIVMFCCVASTSFADPISDVATGGTTSPEVKKIGQNAVANVLTIGAAAGIIILVISLIAMAAGRPAWSKVAFWVSVALIVVVTIIGAFTGTIQAIGRNLLDVATPSPASTAP